ncbi:Asp23/Gls24 family envelope stress response protein [bacterium 210820-DFI.6.37]|nr:Asp23/Gls24 family envelope stress response protein [bacterium 210820-DFI.6.37]
MANEQKNGTLKISDEVVAVCAANATLKTAGVADLAGDFTNALSKSILGKELLSKGVKASQTEEGVVVDIFVIVDYQVNIPSVAWEIQEHVKNEIISMTELPVKTVNINVQGVRVPEKEAQNA